MTHPAQAVQDTQAAEAAGAAKPSLHVSQKVQLPLPASEVWQLLHDFGRVQDWHPAVARTQITAGVNNVTGAVRLLTFLDGGLLEEKLTRYEPQDMRLSYIISKAYAFPVSNYSTTLSVHASPDDDKAGQSWVVWQGDFSRADPSAQPAAGQDDESAVAAVTGVYTTGFRALEKMVTDRKSIQRVISYYADGGTNGDAQTVAKAFHPSATMKFIKESQLVDEPIEAFYKNYIRPGVVQQRTVAIDHIDIAGTAASARLTIDYPTHQFIDYFNLLKIDGQWLVVSKIFHRISKP